MAKFPSWGLGNFVVEPDRENGVLYANRTPTEPEKAEFVAFIESTNAQAG